MSKDKGLLFFYDWVPHFERLSAKDFKMLFLAMCYYQSANVIPPEFPDRLKTIAGFVFSQLDRRKYLSEIGKKGAESRYGKESEPMAGHKGANSYGNGRAMASVMALDREKTKNKTYTMTERETKAANGAAENGGSADSLLESESEFFEKENGGFMGSLSESESEFFEKENGGSADTLSESEKGVFEKENGGSADSLSESEKGVFEKENGGSADTLSESEKEDFLEEREALERDKALSAEDKYGYGTYKNVYLSNGEYLSLRRKIPDADGYIDHFSEKLKNKGYRYPNHFAAIMRWWEQDKHLELNGSPTYPPRRAVEESHYGSFDTDSFFEAAVRRSLGLDSTEKIE